MTQMNRLYLFITTLVVGILLTGMVTYMLHVEIVLKTQSETIECIYKDQKELDNNGKEVYNKYMELNNEIITTKERLDEVSRGKLEMDSNQTWDRREMLVSYYTASTEECGNSRGVTASGEIATVGTTVAMGNNIPFGTKVRIDGHIFIVQDRGNYINDDKIDVLVGTTEEAFSRGIQHKTVYILQ